MHIDIRRARPGDECLFADIADDVFDEAIDPALLTAYLAEPAHLMLIALYGGQVVGQARAIIHRHPDQGPELYVDNLGVTPALRRQGIARRLMDEIYALGRAAGCVETWVGTEPDNEPAKRLYASYGAELETFVMYARDL
jgi:ribosomal protein S18 acetylase RimI-like enzyme